MRLAAFEGRVEVHDSRSLRKLCYHAVAHCDELIERGRLWTANIDLKLRFPTARCRDTGDVFHKNAGFLDRSEPLTDLVHDLQLSLIPFARLHEVGQDGGSIDLFHGAAADGGEDVLDRLGEIPVWTRCL